MRSEDEIRTRLGKAGEAVEHFRAEREKTGAESLSEVAWLYYDAALRFVLGEPSNTASTLEPFAGRTSKEGRYKELVADIHSCRACKLGQSGSNHVPGYGWLRADVALIGEAPGKYEEREGYPFVKEAPAGGIIREAEARVLAGYHTFWMNCLCCRPVSTAQGRENDKPGQEHIAACRDNFNRQLFLVDPKVVLALGGVAGGVLLSEDLSPGRMRGRLWWHCHFPVIVSWHPSYVARNGGIDTKQGQQLLNDLELVKALLRVVPRGEMVREAYGKAFMKAMLESDWR